MGIFSGHKKENELILVFNIGPGNHRVIDSTNGTDVSLSTNTGHTFFTDGTKWYNV